MGGHQADMRTMILLVLALGCSSGPSGDPCYPTTLPLSLCDPGTATFTLDSTNRYYPLITGSLTVLEGEDDGEFIRIERRVLDEVENVGGVMTHVLEHTEWVDGEIEEIARNFYVETTDGTVCYFGEDVQNFRNGMPSNTNGSWRVGVDGAVPGIIMPANPAVGDAYFQEMGLDAMDMGRVVQVGATMTVNGTSYDDMVQIMDVNPLETCNEEEPKLYVPGIGEVADVDVVLVEYSEPAS